MTKIIRRTIRQGDDFKIAIVFKDREGKPIDAITQEFKFVYKDLYGESYEVSFNGSKRTNCYVEDGHLVGVFENYELACCVLKREAYYWVSDDDFSDGQWNYGDTTLSGIELTQDGGVRQVEEIIEILGKLCVNETLILSKGEKGDDGSKIIEVVNEAEAIEKSAGDTKNFYVWALR